MIGAILAGGYGKRLKPITDEIPKALVQIRENYTIMDRQVFDFANIGIRDLYVLSGYRGEKIEEMYGSEHMGIRFHYLREDKPLGTLFSLRNLLNETSDEDILLRNGDTVTDLNFKRFVNFSQASDYGIVMFVARMRSPFGIVDTLGDQITKFREKPYLDHYINAGIYYIKKKAFPYFSRDYMDRDVETTVFPMLANDKLAGAFTEETMWLGIDSEKDLDQIRKDYADRDDEPWGYRKDLYSTGDRKLSEYFVKADEKVTLEAPEGAIIRIMDGMGLAVHDTTRKFISQDIIPFKGTLTLEPRSNTHLEFITI